jgi:putative ABC transport system ATP-binding protein
MNLILKKNQFQFVIKNIKKSYWTGDIEIKALDGISLQVGKGDFKMILGPSGSGKTTLMNILGGLDSADSGEIIINLGNGKFKDIRKFTKKELTNYRRKHIGIIFQFYNLIPILTALENVELAARFSGISNPKKKSIGYLSELGLGDKLNRYPNQLSGGEQQRVAIARALVKNPALILADEPTGNLDSVKTEEIYKILKKLSEEYNKTILIVTHDEDMANKYAKEHIHIRDGKLTKNQEGIER